MNTSLAASILTKSWFLVGPTASGKTATAGLLAHRLNAEIVSLDSMTIYRGMNIGTAKPSQQELQQTIHHLIDIAEPHEEFSVAEFIRMASDAASAIIARQRTPLFVGGTGLYLRSVLRGLSEGPPADWDLRHELQDQVARSGSHWLHQQLQLVDAPSAARLHPHDVRRVIRAIEVFRLTGRRLSDDQTQHPRPPQERPRAVVWLEPPREWLYERIDRRVEQMIQDGWLAETEALLQRTPACSRTARQALGYRELIAVLEHHQELPEAIRHIQTATRQFAKRQHTWFRNLEECQSLTISGSETTDELCKRIENIAAKDHRQT